MKYLLAVLMMGLLSACSLGASSPSEQPLESMAPSESASMQPSPTPSPSQSASMAGSPAESAAASPMTSQACQDAWQSVDVSAVKTIGDLVDIGDQLRGTFQDCSSVADWVNTASESLPQLNSGDLQSWASAQCTLDGAIADSPVCTDFTS